MEDREDGWTTQKSLPGLSPGPWAEAHSRPKLAQPQVQLLHSLKFLLRGIREECQRHCGAAFIRMGLGHFI